MQTLFFNALCKLLQTVEQSTGENAYAVIRNGRFANLYSSARAIDHSLPSNALDTIEKPLLASQSKDRHANLPAAVGAADLLLWPVLGQAGKNVATLCLAQTQPHENIRPLLESVANTLGVLIETLESNGVHAARSLHDPLTHLPNHALLNERLSDEISSAQRTNTRVGLLTIDLDGFTEINTTHGRAFGDRVLQKIAARLHHSVRRSDILARLAEDEFALIAVSMTDQPQGAHVATRLLRTLSQPMEVDGVSITPSASVGIAVFPCDGLDVDTLVANSHAAMHRAKIRGQNQFEYYTPQMNADAMERIELESRLRLAVEKNQLLLHYQPIVDRDGHITGLESLVRWNHPDQGMIPPGKFIPIAEQTGMIIPIGTWVLQQSCQQAAQWALQGMPLRVNVNVSTLQFIKDDFEEIVIDALQRSALPPKLLEIELTEGVFVHETPQLAAKLARIRKLGVRIAIDDFGAGYSSLSRVHNLPIDTLKIDRAFINEISVKDAPTPLHHRTAVLRAMATLGHSLGLRLVAEGVETEDQAAFVRRIGYDGFQGYLYSKPVPADQIPALVQRLGLGDAPLIRLSEAA